MRYPVQMSRGARTITRIPAAILALHAAGAAGAAIRVGEPILGLGALLLGAASLLASRWPHRPRAGDTPRVADHALLVGTAVVAIAALAPVLHPEATYVPPYTGLSLCTPGVAVALLGFGVAGLAGRRAGVALPVAGWRRFWRAFCVAWLLGVTTLATRALFWLHRPLFDAALTAPTRRVGLYPFADAGRPPDSRGATATTVFQVDPGWPTSGAGFYHVPPDARHPTFNAGSDVDLGGGWWMYTTE